VDDADMTIPIRTIDEMSPDEERQFWRQFEAAIRRDDGSVAQAHLDAGRPVYQQADDSPDDLIEKIYPDGHRQLVRFDLTGEHLVSELASAWPRQEIGRFE